jgi:hypothetical protein
MVIGWVTSYFLGSVVGAGVEVGVGVVPEVALFPEQPASDAINKADITNRVNTFLNFIVIPLVKYIFYLIHYCRTGFFREANIIMS